MTRIQHQFSISKGITFGVSTPYHPILSKYKSRSHTQRLACSTCSNSYIVFNNINRELRFHDDNENDNDNFYVYVHKEVKISKRERKSFTTESNG